MSTSPVAGPDAPPTGTAQPAGPPLLHRVRDFLLGYPQRPDAPEGSLDGSVSDESVPAGPGDPVTPPGAPGPGEPLPTEPLPGPTEPLPTDPVPTDPLPQPIVPEPLPDGPPPAPTPPRTLPTPPD